MPFADEVSLLRSANSNREADVVCSERTRKDARHTCGDPLRRCGGKGSASQVTRTTSPPSTTCPTIDASAAFTDIDATACTPHQTNLISSVSSPRNARYHARRTCHSSTREFAAHAHSSCVSLGHPLPHRLRRTSRNASSGIATSVRPGRSCGRQRSRQSRPPRPGEPIDDLHRIEFGRPSRRTGVRAHAASYRLRQGQGLASFQPHVPSLASAARLPFARSSSAAFARAL